jgi:hypothetical protein
MSREKKSRPAAAAVAAIAMAIWAGGAGAAEVKRSGSLDVPANATIVAICTDPVVQNALGDAIRTARRKPADPNAMVTITVTVNKQTLAPGVSLNQLFPGDPSMVELLKQAGADPPPLGDTGNEPSADAYSIEARRRALNPQDSMTDQDQKYQALQNAMRGAHAPTPYDSIPKDQIYDSVIVARASAEGSADQLKVVAVLHSGEDLRKAKILVAEEIANAVLH